MGHFNRPGARFTRKRFYVCGFGATKDAMSGSKMSMRVLLLRGIPAWSLPGVFLLRRSCSPRRPYAIGTYHERDLLPPLANCPWRATMRSLRPPTKAASGASYQTYRDARTITITATTANKPNCAHKLSAGPRLLLSLCIVMGDETPSLTVAFKKVLMIGKEH